MYKDNAENQKDFHPDSDTGKEVPHNNTEPGEPEKKKDRPKKAAVEKLPLGTGYLAEELPIEVMDPEVSLTENDIPDLVKEAEITEELDEPIPAPEDEYYDFKKDIYGDEADYKP